MVVKATANIQSTVIMKLIFESKQVNPVGSTIQMLIESFPALS